MTDYFIYLDESGTLDFLEPANETESPFFGFGSAMFLGEHRDAIWQGHLLRAALEAKKVNLPHGFHAKNDSWATREAVLKLISTQPLRFDATFLYKANAFPYVQSRGKSRLYKIALFLHLQRVCSQFKAEDRLYVVLATFSAASFKDAAKEAIEDIANQMVPTIIPCVWDAKTAWGIQVADYLLWATHRITQGRALKNYSTYVEPLIASVE